MRTPLTGLNNLDAKTKPNNDVIIMLSVEIQKVCSFSTISQSHLNPGLGLIFAEISFQGRKRSTLLQYA
jgi:hypothetical protein